MSGATTDRARATSAAPLGSAGGARTRPWRVGVRPGRQAPPTSTNRHDVIMDVITAAGIQPTYEITQGNICDLLFSHAIIERDLTELSGSSWPYDGALVDRGTCLIRDGDTGVYELSNGVIVYLNISSGWFRMRVAAPERATIAATMTAFKDAYPPLYRQVEDDGTIPITFWTDGDWGPTRRLRMIEGSPWADIEANYSADIRAELGQVMLDFEPGADGQLLLWLGPPGTGKTWALRALAHEWADWAEFNYITDPDAFFVDNPSYMIDVLLADSYDELTVEGDVVTTDRQDKWRVLILEDTGELLAADAKDKQGQGLSRLLNVVDGMVGQGLRILAIVTTNDELGDLHPAVTRPGRCASRIAFGALSAAEASVWLGEPCDEGGTLAELYARRSEPLVASLIPDEQLEEIIALALSPLPDLD